METRLLTGNDNEKERDKLITVAGKKIHTRRENEREKGKG